MVENQEPRKVFVWRTEINNFHYLYGDAEHLREAAKSPAIAKDFRRVILSRSSLLLYILSLEALINRVMAHFLPERVRAFLLEREDRFSVEDKWGLVALLAGEVSLPGFDKSVYPWSHLSELVRIRNDYVHPKHNRYAYYRAVSAHEFESLDWAEVPKDLGIKETDLVYRQTLIPKDPYSILPEHVDRVKIIVDDSVGELDRLLQGAVCDNNWLRGDQMSLIFPPGATIGDLPRDAAD